MLDETKKRAIKEKLAVLLIREFPGCFLNRFEKVKTRFYMNNLTFRESMNITKVYVKLSRKTKRKLYKKIGGRQTINSVKTFILNDYL